MGGLPMQGGAIFAVTVLALVASSSRVASGLKIDIDAFGKECIVEHAEREQDTFTGSFMLIEENQFRNTWDAFEMTVRDENREVVYDARHTSEHRFEFSAERAGRHEFCFKNLKHYQQTLYYHAHVGHHWAHGAVTTKSMDELHQSLASLRQIVGAVDEEVRYQKTRETAQFKTSKTINGRVVGYSMLEAAALVMTAVFQALYLKRLFESKSERRATGV